MSNLIVLTGFMGSGKSYAAKRFEDRTYRIDGDRLFSTSHRVLRPDMPEPEKNDWDKWPQDRRDPTTLTGVLAESLPKAEPGLARHRGDVIADGAIFVYDWFREPLIEVLGRGLPVESVYLLNLALPNDRLHRNIHTRGEQHQMEQYPTVEAVKRGNDGFKRKFGPSRWEEFGTYEAFEERIGGILSLLAR